MTILETSEQVVDSSDPPVAPPRRLPPAPARPPRRSSEADSATTTTTTIIKTTKTMTTTLKSGEEMSGKKMIEITEQNGEKKISSAPINKDSNNNNNDANNNAADDEISNSKTSKKVGEKNPKKKNLFNKKIALKTFAAKTKTPKESANANANANANNEDENTKNTKNKNKNKKIKKDKKNKKDKIDKNGSTSNVTNDEIPKSEIENGIGDTSATAKITTTTTTTIIKSGKSNNKNNKITETSSTIKSEGTSTIAAEDGKLPPTIIARHRWQIENVRYLLADERQFPLDDERQNQLYIESDQFPMPSSALSIATSESRPPFFSLRLYPHGCDSEHRKFVSLELLVHESSNPVTRILIQPSYSFRFALLDADGETEIHSRAKKQKLSALLSNSPNMFADFIERDRLFAAADKPIVRESPHDRLTLRCEISIKRSPLYAIFNDEKSVQTAESRVLAAAAGRHLQSFNRFDARRSCFGHQWTIANLKLFYVPELNSNATNAVDSILVTKSARLHPLVQLESERFCPPASPEYDHLARSGSVRFFLRAYPYGVDERNRLFFAIALCSEPASAGAKKTAIKKPNMKKMKNAVTQLHLRSHTPKPIKLRYRLALIDADGNKCHVKEFEDDRPFVGSKFATLNATNSNSNLNQQQQQQQQAATQPSDLRRTERVHERFISHFELRRSADSLLRDDKLRVSCEMEIIDNCSSELERENWMRIFRHKKHFDMPQAIDSHSQLDLALRTVSFAHKFTIENFSHIIVTRKSSGRIKSEPFGPETPDPSNDSSAISPRFTLTFYARGRARDRRQSNANDCIGVYLKLASIDGGDPRRRKSSPLIVFYRISLLVREQDSSSGGKERIVASKGTYSRFKPKSDGWGFPYYMTCDDLRSKYFDDQKGTLPGDRLSILCEIRVLDERQFDRPIDSIDESVFRSYNQVFQGEDVISLSSPAITAARFVVPDDTNTGTSANSKRREGRNKSKSSKCTIL